MPMLLSPPYLLRRVFAVIVERRPLPPPSHTASRAIFALLALYQSEL